MVYRYSDKTVILTCMPDGFTPTYKVEDNPLMAIQWAMKKNHYWQKRQN